MMTTKTKTEETNSLLRTPKAKNKLGLKIPKIAMPHDDLIFPDKPRFEIVPNKNQDETLTSHTSQSLQNEREIAPSRNYQKVANSITKQAIPEGLFKGKDKHLYDVLYSLTRGAIEPKRSVRISKTKLMKMASIGSRITFDSCVERLEKVGLLILKVFTGEHEGNEFEILLPEELESMPSQTSLTTQTSPAQKLDRVLILETSQTSQSLNSMNTGISTMPKTSFKDFKYNDDESASAFSEFVEKFSEACKRITGKPTTSRERKGWGILADLLILEFESAARRADSISSAPAFLTEVLRRKLLIGTSNTFRRQNTNPDTVGKPDETDKYEIKALDGQGREEALEHLKEFADSAFFTDFKQWYTKGDWDWLIIELEKAKKRTQS